VNPSSPDQRRGLSLRPKLDETMKQISQRYLERVMRAAMKVGVPFGGFEIRPDGTVAVLAQGSGPTPVDALDDELAKWRKSHGSH
jgi:hypothetical protein